MLLRAVMLAMDTPVNVICRGTGLENAKTTQKVGMSTSGQIQLQTSMLCLPILFDVVSSTNSTECKLPPTRAEGQRDKASRYAEGFLDHRYITDL